MVFSVLKGFVVSSDTTRCAVPQTKHLSQTSMSECHITTYQCSDGCPGMLGHMSTFQYYDALSTCVCTAMYVCITCMHRKGGHLHKYINLAIAHTHTHTQTLNVMEKPCARSSIGWGKRTAIRSNRLQLKEKKWTWERERDVYVLPPRLLRYVKMSAWVLPRSVLA